MSNYSLEIISHHKDFNNKNLRKYYVDGIETVGAYGNEPFEIRFTNHTYSKVQVKLSLDGTDILTGDVANTDASAKMWVVNGYGTLNLKAFPETSNGGAAFVFTNVDNSVAAHTHGNMSSRGIIAAAVYTEGYIQPINYFPYTTVFIPYTIPFYSDYKSYLLDVPSTWCYNSTTINVNNVNSTITNSINDLPAVGAGEYVDQKISYATSLIQPMLSETIRIRYLWWDDLKAKLHESNVTLQHPSGFPGSQQYIMSLGNTPRINTSSQVTQKQPTPVYSRV